MRRSRGGSASSTAAKPPRCATFTTCFCEARHSAPGRFRRCEAHHGIEGLGEDATVVAADGETRRPASGSRPAPPRTAADRRPGGRFLQTRFPRGLLGQGTDGDAMPAVVAVRLEHELRTIASHVFKELAVALTRQAGATVADEPRPQHMLF